MIWADGKKKQVEEAQEGSEDPTDLKTEAKRRRSALLEEGAAALREDDEAEVRRCRVGLRELFDDQAWELSFPDATKAFRFDPGLSLGDVESASPTRLKNLLGQVQKRLHKEVKKYSLPSGGGLETWLRAQGSLYRVSEEMSQDLFLHALLLNKQMRPSAAFEAWVALNARNSKWKRKNTTFLNYR
jgi:hypothetical protein|tara:strand:- start:231 stop:788 length:558 start_codon:yes stop_codon:yes gene_type:complete